MEIWTIIALITIITNIVLAIYYLLSKNIKSQPKLHLSITFITFSLWGITQLLNYTYFEPTISLLSVRIAYGLVVIGVVHIYLFISAYVSSFSKQTNKYKFIIIDLLIILLSISPLLVNKISLINETIVPQNNDMVLILYMFIVLTVVSLILLNVIKFFKKGNNDIIRFSLILFGISITITVISGILFNYLLPNFLPAHVKASPLIGFSSTIIFTTTTAYIFSRTQYYSLKTYVFMIIKQSFLILFYVLSFLLISYLLQKLWGSVFSFNSIVSGIFLAILFIPVTSYTLTVINKLLFKNTIKVEDKGYLTLIRDVFEANDYSNLYLKLNNLIQNQAIPSQFSMLFDKPKQLAFGPFSDIAELNKIFKELPLDSDLVVNSEEKITKSKYKDFINLLDLNNIEVIKVLHNKSNEICLLIFSKKFNNQIYTVDELIFIDNLEYIVNLALDNITLFQSKENFNQLLQQKVDTQTHALQKAYDQLKMEDEGKNDILNIVSHQLLTPISIIRGEIEELKETSDKKTQEEMLTKLASESKRSFEIVDEILRVSRVIQNGGYMVINKTQVDIVKMIQETIEPFKTKAQKINLKLDFIKPDKPKGILIDIDREKINEAISNLVDNAINYTQKGGVTVTLINNPKDIQIKIKDTGIGIKKEDLKQLFNKFIRLENAKKYRPDGTGIGLYFVKLVMDAHNGKITVTSEGEGKGSEFILTLLK